VNNGIFICLNCSGIHRGFGVSISFVRSVSMDSWSDKQLNLMSYGGNSRFHNFLEQYKLNEQPPHLVYKSKAAQYYRAKVFQLCLIKRMNV
jgi:ADP-ribosylation factor GTPase-activating protein 1